MANEKIKAEALVKGVRHYQIAEKLGVSDATFYRMMRHDLTPDQTQHVINLIDDIAHEQKR